MALREDNIPPIVQTIGGIFNDRVSRGFIKQNVHEESLTEILYSSISRLRATSPIPQHI
jgi:hypothetical protein